jgi:hypothetical protein
VQLDVQVVCQTRFVLSVVEVLDASGIGEFDAILEIAGVAGRDQVSVVVVGLAAELIRRGVDRRANGGAARRTRARAAGQVAEAVIGLTRRNALGAIGSQ